MDEYAPRQQLLLKEYELGIQYLTNQYSRMWMRFNFFITLDTALAVALVGFSKDKWVPLLAIAIGTVGLITSVFWYVFGAQDRYYVEAYRRQIGHTAAELWKREDSWPYIGLSPVDIQRRTKKKIPRTLLQWGWDPLSVTKLAAAFPLLVVLIWLALVITIVLLMYRTPASVSFTVGIVVPLAAVAVLIIVTRLRSDRVAVSHAIPLKESQNG